MERLLDQDETTRGEASQELMNQASDSPLELEPKVPEMLSYIQRSHDNVVSMQIASAIHTIHESLQGTGQKYSKEIFETLDHNSSREAADDDDQSMIDLIATHLFTTQFDHQLAISPVLKDALPVIFKYLKKEGSVRYLGYRMVAQIIEENPRALEDYIGEIIQTIGQGMTELAALLSSLYHIRPEKFEAKLDLLMQIYQIDKNTKTLVLLVYAEMAKKNPRVFEPYLDELVLDLKNPNAATTISVMLGEIARLSPQSVYPYLSDLKQSIEYVDTLKYTIPNIVGLLGRTSDEVAREVLPFLAGLLQTTDSGLIVTVLMEIRNLGEMNREILEPYMEVIQGLTDDPQEYVRDQALLIMDIWEGRDFRTLAAQIEEQNKKIAEIATSVDALRAYVDENIEMLKQFISEVIKRLPVPVTFSTEGRVRKTMHLHFVCGIQNDRCLYPEDRSFIAETKTWHRWLKLAMSAVKIGKAVFLPPEMGDAVDAVRSTYAAYKSGDDKDFLTFISEPFLTSEEQDNLITQLRKAKYFDVFNYDSQSAGWACIMCKQPDS